MKRKRKLPKGATVVEIACTSKVRMPTEGMARMFAMRALYRLPKRSRMWVYLCEFCDGWHTTSRPSGLPAVKVD